MQIPERPMLGLPPTMPRTDMPGKVPQSISGMGNVNKKKNRNNGPQASI